MRTGLPPDRLLAHLDADAARILDLAGKDLEAAVPPCPGWTVAEVVRHTGSVYGHKVATMRLPMDGDLRRPQRWDDAPGEGRDLLDWFGERHAELAAELRERGPEAPSHTWFGPDQTVGFWYRRMAQETAVHRVDVESAFDVVSPVADDLAVDGIDEVLDVFLVHGHDPGRRGGPGRGTVAVRTGEHVWRVTLADGGEELSREPGRCDAVVSGEPSELLLWLWGRRPDTAVAREGDAAAVDGLRARLVAATQ